MLIHRIMTALVLLFSANVFAACDCQWNGPFTWLTDDAGAIILGKVVAHKGNSLDLEVEQVLKGKEFRETIRIWGQQQNDCRANLNQFASNTRWVFALDTITEIPPGGFNPATPNISYGRLKDYGLQRCGAYWLKAEGDKVSGNLTSVFDWEYQPEMTPVPISLVQQFIDGEVSYGDIISVSDEITSGDAMLRKSKREMGLGDEWDH